MVSTHLKNISQIGNLPQIGMKTKNIWNHHLVHLAPLFPAISHFKSRHHIHLAQGVQSNFTTLGFTPRDIEPRWVKIRWFRGEFTRKNQTRKHQPQTYLEYKKS